jgi:lysine 2,3-aminomutase
MKEKFTPHINSLLGSEAISRQYITNGTSKPEMGFAIDPLMEDDAEVVKGVVHKYSNRALIKVSYRCAAHCRFCTRFRQIGSADGDLEQEDLDRIVDYIKRTPEIDDVILSGGDPLYSPKETKYLLSELATISSVKIIRIGTRLPIHSPNSFASKLISELVEFAATVNIAAKPVHILVNIEHPDELTEATISVLKDLRKKGFTLLSQTVFLKGVNDRYEILFDLFQRLYHLGVIPYYIYRCDYVKGIEGFVVDLEKERSIMTRLKSNISGIACPTYVVDVPGHGKLPVPLNYWHVPEIDKCTDYLDTSIQL